jgi:hypothetical protein
VTDPPCDRVAELPPDDELPRDVELIATTWATGMEFFIRDGRRQQAPCLEGLASASSTAITCAAVAP